MLGRTWAPDEATVLGASALAVISDRFWKFAGTADAVGKTFKMNGARLATPALP